MIRIQFLLLTLKLCLTLLHKASCFCAGSAFWMVQTIHSKVFETQQNDLFPNSYSKCETFFFSSVGLVYWTASKIIAQKIRLNRMIHSKTPTSLSPAVTLNIFHVFSSLSWFKQFNQNMYHQTFPTKICCFSPCFAAHPGLITHQFQCNLKVRLLCIASVYYGLSGN